MWVFQIIGTVVLAATPFVLGLFIYAQRRINIIQGKRLNKLERLHHKQLLFGHLPPSEHECHSKRSACATCGHAKREHNLAAFGECYSALPEGGVCKCREYIGE